MPRADVRAGIQKYLSNAGIADLGQVFAHAPKITPAQDLYEHTPPGEGTGAVIYIHLEKQNGHRVAMGGPTSGKKIRVYLVTLVCYLRSRKPDTQEVGADNDAFLDALVGAIEASRTAAGAVFQWGEGTVVGATDIDVDADMPRGLGKLGVSQVFSTVRVYALEMLTT